MATLDNLRVTALLLKSNLAAVYADVLPIYSLSAFWTVTGIDDDLPDEGEVKLVLDAYDGLKIPRNTADIALRDVKASTEAFEGVFSLPATAFLVPFTFSGPVFAPLSQSQGFGVALTLQRLTVFVQSAGTSGDALTIDIRVDGVTMLTAPISIAAATGENIGIIVPSSQIVTTAIPPSGVLSAHILTAPADAAGVGINIWVQS